MQWPTMDSRVKSRFWKRIYKIKKFSKVKKPCKNLGFDPRFDTPKTRQLCTRYARLFRNFQESRKKCKKSSEIHRFRNFPGGDKRDRTADLLNAIQALSRYNRVHTPLKGGGEALIHRESDQFWLTQCRLKTINTQCKKQFDELRSFTNGTKNTRQKSGVFRDN